MSALSKGNQWLMVILLTSLLLPGVYPTAALSPPLAVETEAFPDRPPPQAELVAWPARAAITANAGWTEVGAGSASGGGISDNGGISDAPSVAVALDGTLYVAWQDSSSGYDEIYVLHWDGATWQEVGAGSASGDGISGTGAAANPSIAVAPDGVPYVAWKDIPLGNEIYVRRWNGSVWEEVGSGSASGNGISDTGFAYGPSLDIAPDGTPYVAWYDGSDVDWEIYVRYWDGSAWEEVGFGSASGGGISDNAGDSSYPALAVDPTDPEPHPYIAWMDDSSGNNEIYVKHWDGNSWEEIGSGSASGDGISVNAGDSRLPSLAVEPDDPEPHPYIAWMDDSSGDWEIYVLRWDGHSWEEAGLGSASGGGISNTGGRSDDPVIAVDPDDPEPHPYIAWMDYSSGDDEIYVRRWDGSGWQEVGAGSATDGGISDIGDIPAVNDGPSLAVGQDGTPYVAWPESQPLEGTDSEIYIRQAECPDATVQSTGDGNWEDAATWNENRVPDEDDVVWVREGHTVSISNPIEVEGLYNDGTLTGSSCDTSGVHIACPCLPPARCLEIKFQANGKFFNGPLGRITVSDGANGGATGADGCSIQLWGSPFTNMGLIRAGDGGDGAQTGGDGGWVQILGRNTTNTGTIRGGDGGDVTGVNAGQAGDGGAVEVWGKWRGAGFLKNTGLIEGGDGGDANPAAGAAQHGGDGGWLCLVSIPYLQLKEGRHFGGAGGKGAAGGRNGRRGSITLEPETISLSGSETRVGGGNVTIFGGDGWVLDLSDMDGASITATHGITLAVGSGGVVDLTGNLTQVLQAGDGVFIASDDIQLDPGVNLSDVAGANVTTGPSQILYDVSLAGPGSATAEAGTPLPLTLTVLNGGPVTDTYTLSVSDTAGWGLDLAASTQVEGIDMRDLTLTVTPPSSADTGDANVITVRASSQADGNVEAVTEIYVTVDSKITHVYLPLVLRNYFPPFFDDFSDPASGWPISNKDTYALDYSNGTYRIEIKEDYKFVWSWPQVTCSDCNIQVEAWRSTGGNSSYGIVFGLDDDGCYFFQVQPYRKEYRLLRLDDRSLVELIPYTGASAINFDTAHNSLRVKREGAQIKLYVNGQYLTTYTDGTYTGARHVGVLGGSGPESPVWLRYDDFSVYGLDQSTVTLNALGLPGIGELRVPPVAP